jgi:hypothetical protein
MVFLLLLVAASAVALVIIRESKQEADRLAQKALNAETEAKASLVVAQAKEKERREALEKEKQARDEERKAREEVVAAAARIQTTNDELNTALRKAKYAQWRTRLAMKRADKNAEAARQAEARAVAAVEKLRKRLQEERERFQKRTGGVLFETFKEETR